MGMGQNYGGGQAVSYVTTDVPPAVTPASQLEMLDGDLCNSLSNFHDITQRLRMLADRIVGPAPEPVTGIDGKASGPPPCLTRKLETTAGYIRAMTGEISNLLTRLERL